MSFETMTPPEAVEAQQNQTDSGNVAVSIEDWNSYKPSPPDDDTQDLVDQGTLPQLDFSADEADTSSGMEYFNAADLDADGEISLGEAATVYVSMDSDYSGSVSEVEFSEFIEESAGNGGAGETDTTGGDKPEGESGGDSGVEPGDEDTADDTVSSGANTYFDAFDLDKDGQFSVSEAVTAFYSMDSDGNGSVNGKEVAKFFKDVSDSVPPGGDEGGGDEGGGYEGGGDEGGGDEGGGYEGGGDEGGGDEGGGYEGGGDEGGGYEGGGDEGGGDEGGGGYEGGGDLPLEREPIGGGGPMEGGMGVVTIDGDAIPPELQKYAHMEGDILVIDAKGEQLPPLRINRDNVVIKNARINAAGSGAEAVKISGSHVQVLDSEITGGIRGILATDGAFDVNIDGNYLHDFDGHAIEFLGAKGGIISNNRITGTYEEDTVNILGSSNVKFVYNEIDVTINEEYSAPFMVEDGGEWQGAGSTHDIEVAYNTINYGGGPNVPPGLLGGYNLNGHDNVVNGDRSRGAWQLYHYEPSKNVWYDVYYDGERLA